MYDYTLTEPTGGNEMLCPLPDPAFGIRTTAVKDGKGYRIKGQKCFITNGGVAEIYMVNCRTKKDQPNIDGCNWLMFHKDTPGYSIGKFENKIGWRAKFSSAQMVHEVTCDASYLFGGYGLMKDLPLEKLVRDGLPNRVVEGSIEANEWMMAQYDLGTI